MAEVMAISEILGTATARLREAGCDTARLDAEVLLMDNLKFDRAGLIAGSDDGINAKDLCSFWSQIQRRQSREPIAHILGTKEFWSLEFRVNAHTLIPRPDSEIIVETCLDYLHDRINEPLEILDLGTGSGCLAISLLSELPNATALATDRSEAALKVAKENAHLMMVEERIRFLQADWCDGLGAEYGNRQFDLIVSNPPYIQTGAVKTLMPEVTNFEPHQALDGGVDGLGAYRIIIPGASSFLKPEGAFVLELGQGQGPNIAHLLRAQSLDDIAFRDDLAGHQRCVIATQTKAKPAG